MKLLEITFLLKKFPILFLILGIIIGVPAFKGYFATGIVKKCYETEIKFPCAKVDQLNTIQCFFNSTTIDSTNNFKTTPQLSCR